MRRVTRNAVLALLLVIVGLLALGVLPSLLVSGDPFYVTAEQTDASALPANGTAINATDLPSRQFSYSTTALSNGTSEYYRKGPWGLKGAFTHSPFDELRALRERYPNSTVGNGVVVRDNGTLYRLAIDQRS